MDNRNIFIKANKALAEGNYKEFITYCRDDIKWENVVRKRLMERPNFWIISTQFIPD